MPERRRFFITPLRAALRRAPLFAALLFAALFFGEAAEAKYASLVVEADSGRVLHEINADTRNYPASLTKMMTLYMVFEAVQEGRLSLQEQLHVSARAAGMQPSKLGLRQGGRITVEDAVLGLVTKSANDAAVVLAEKLGGSEVEFARLMTAKAKSLGMKNTSFRNASGLPNKGQLSTARDMSVLARALMQKPARALSLLQHALLHLQGQDLQEPQPLAQEAPRHRRHQDGLHPRLGVQCCRCD